MLTWKYLRRTPPDFFRQSNFLFSVSIETRESVSINLTLHPILVELNIDMHLYAAQRLCFADGGLTDVNRPLALGVVCDLHTSPFSPPVSLSSVLSHDLHISTPAGTTLIQFERVTDTVYWSGMQVRALRSLSIQRQLILPWSKRPQMVTARKTALHFRISV